MNNIKKARAVGINHIALEVGDIEEALDFYGLFLEFKLRGKSDKMAFIDLGDQFIALSAGREQPTDDDRHFGLVVDDKQAVGEILNNLNIKMLSERFMDFHDPWGNRIEIVEYKGVQFTKDRDVLNGMQLSDMRKTPDALKQLEEKGMAPSSPEA
ncbi:MAG: VOC family protein [Desulfobulbia bacterium]